MKLHIFAFTLVISCNIFASDNPKAHIAISMPHSLWSLIHSTKENDITIKSYYLSNGPKHLPLEIQTFEWIASIPFCCCPQAIKKYVAHFKNNHEDTYDPHTKTLRKYYYYKKIDT